MVLCYCGGCLLEIGCLLLYCLIYLVWVLGLILLFVGLFTGVSVCFVCYLIVLFWCWFSFVWVVGCLYCWYCLVCLLFVYLLFTVVDVLFCSLVVYCWLVDLFVVRLFAGVDCCWWCWLLFNGLYVLVGIVVIVVIACRLFFDFFVLSLV